MGVKVGGFSGRRLEINRECSFQELMIEFHYIPFHSDPFHSNPFRSIACFTQCQSIALGRESLFVCYPLLVIVWFLF